MTKQHGSEGGVGLAENISTVFWNPISKLIEARMRSVLTEFILQSLNKSIGRLHCPRHASRCYEVKLHAGKSLKERVAVLIDRH
jgi:hypothetical protein